MRSDMKSARSVDSIDSHSGSLRSGFAHPSIVSIFHFKCSSFDEQADIVAVELAVADPTVQGVRHNPLFHESDVSKSDDDFCAVNELKALQRVSQGQHY
jgi:hypothetical protein